ncbi:MAG: hypothetical protein EA373_09345, partial [Oceanospirillales bacterium]
SLDITSEKQILESLKLLCEGRTTLLLTHRPASMKIAKRIYVLDQGKCYEADLDTRARLEQEVQ